MFRRKEDPIELTRFEWYFFGLPSHSQDRALFQRQQSVQSDVDKFTMHVVVSQDAFTHCVAAFDPEYLLS
jgi:hypothetical protein